MKHPSDLVSRADQAKKILAILQDYLGPDLSRFNCLDIGCANGIISHHIANHARYVIGFDIDYLALNEATSLYSKKKNNAFTIANGFAIPFSASTFDIVICAQVYEHATDQPALAREIWRILRPGGVCFFSGPNRLAIMEEHYWLPFLSWLPQSLSHLYMRVFRRGKFYDAYPRFYWQILQLWKAFDIHDYTPRLLHEPEKFAMGDRLKKNSWIRRVPPGILKALKVFFPNYNWILVKPF